VLEAIGSVQAQTYPNVELIVVDDASSDNSQRLIGDYLKDFPAVKFIPIARNVGNCKAFNMGWQASSGNFIIDLAADDVLHPERITVGVECFLQSGPDYGVHYTDARIINTGGREVGQHLTANFFAGEVPQGFIFTALLGRYFINPVTMMYSKSLLDYLGGYDETLAYEDFDLWVRSAKKFKYCYTNQLLVSKRQVGGSHGKRQYRPFSNLLSSTLKVCDKAFALCEHYEEFSALLTRINYEMKMALVSFNWQIAYRFYKLRQRVLKKLVL
jgi:glycosyltransferase involved in cell wall biosynthesis